MDIKEKASLYRSQIVSRMRQDVYAFLFQKNGRKYYYPNCKNRYTKTCTIGIKSLPCSECPQKVRETVTDDVIEKHLKGTNICGFYPLFPDGFCQMTAIDLDEEHTFQDLKSITFYLREIKFHPYPATSTSKGWHVYLFLDKPVKARIPRALLNLVCQDIGITPIPEIFPKQSQCVDLGSLIRPPLSIPDVEKGRCAFLDIDNGFEPFGVEEQFEMLKTIRTSSASEMIKIVDALGLFEEAKEKELNIEKLPLEIRPCVQEIIKSGTVEGRRNDTGFIIANELKRFGKSREYVMEIMKSWNRNNQPPMDISEVHLIVHSAFTHGYLHSCKSDSLQRLIRCENMNECVFYQEWLKKNAQAF